MKFEIQTYKDQTIYYEETFDAFTCDISSEDKFRTTKRNKLDDVRKEIDKFVKMNLDFKPFKVLRVGSYERVEVYTVEAIRADGKFILNKGSYKEHKSAKELEDNYFVYDVDAVKKNEEFAERRESLKKEEDAFIKSLESTLARPNLSKYRI